MAVATNALKGFNGLPSETIDFLARLEENNYREWFNEHKSAAMATGGLISSILVYDLSGGNRIGKSD